MEIPRYSRQPRELPEDLRQETQGEVLQARHAAIQRELVKFGSSTASSLPVLTTFLNDDGVVAIPNQEGGGYCLPAFSMPLAAIDYEQTLLRDGPRVQYRTSTPTQFVTLLQHLKAGGLDSFTIDRCPRCSTFTCVTSSAIESADDVLNAWAVFKATNLVLADSYHAYALRAARSDRLELARDVSLHAVSTLTFEDARFHFLLGQIAVALRDPILLAEARVFLRFLDLSRWEQKLAEIEKSGTPDFTKLPPPIIREHQQDLRVQVDWRRIDLVAECGVSPDITRRDLKAAYYPNEGNDAWVVWISLNESPLLKLETDSEAISCTTAPEARAQ